ncbi:MAG: M3 family oligoendopeptidase [Polyangiaceae bacterium]
MTPPLDLRWDLTAYFPSFDSPARVEFEARLDEDVATLVREASALGELSEATADAWASVIARYEDLLARLGHLSSYVGCLAAADAADERFSLAEARLAKLRAGFEKLPIELRRALGGAPEALFEGFITRPSLATGAHHLRQIRVEARTSMAPALEGLAADLGPDGIGGWGRLYDVVSAKLTFEMVYPDGRRETLPMAQRRSLQADADRDVRRAAFEGGNKAWQGALDVTAAAINHIAGTRLVLNARRGVKHFLDVALHQAAISEKTLRAMFEAVDDRIEIPRAGFRAKARALKLEACQFYDLEAPFPLPGAERVTMERGVELVRTAFGKSYPRLREHFDAMIARNWIEAMPSDKKRPGAFCTSSDVTNEARVFMTFQGSLGDVSTLAHEVGHAFHAEVMKKTRTLARQYPMTLAETASTFAQLLLSDGLLESPSTSAETRALLLGEIVNEGAAFLLDVPMRFRFEEAFHVEREKGEVTATRLSELMAEAQRKQFGDSLAPGGEDPLFWASKLHFYIPDLTFYNFPYTFGYLLSRGLFAMLKAEGPSFLSRYEAFLEGSGSALAHEVARNTLGRDLESPDFWADAIDTLRAPLAALENSLGAA